MKDDNLFVFVINYFHAFLPSLFGAFFFSVDPYRSISLFSINNGFPILAKQSNVMKLNFADLVCRNLSRLLKALNSRGF